MENKWHYIIGAICIPCVIGGITLLDSHPNWAYALFFIAAVAIFWGVYPVLFKRASMSKATDITPKTPLSDADKLKISTLMETVNSINDNMDRFMEEALYGGGDRVEHYRKLIDETAFRELWDKCSSQSAQVSVVSPKLSELVWSLLKFTQSHHRYFLQEWRVSQLGQLNKETDEHLSAILIFRKSIQRELEELLSRGGRT